MLGFRGSSEAYCSFNLDYSHLQILPCFFAIWYSGVHLLQKLCVCCFPSEKAKQRHKIMFVSPDQDYKMLIYFFLFPQGVCRRMILLYVV